MVIVFGGGVTVVGVVCVVVAVVVFGFVFGGWVVVHTGHVNGGTVVDNYFRRTDMRRVSMIIMRIVPNTWWIRIK